MASKRRRTTWMFRVPYKGGCYIRVGRVHNQERVPEDIVRWQIVSAEEDGSQDYSATLDEAAALASGLMYVLASELVADAGSVRKRYR